MSCKYLARRTAGFFAEPKKELSDEFDDTDRHVGSTGNGYIRVDVSHYVSRYVDPDVRFLVAARHSAAQLHA
jgi:hypothetical protein